MIILVCGGRDFNQYTTAFKALSALPFEVTKVVNGGARGADKISSRWAKDNSIELAEYPAEWNKHGRAAGPIRNSEMLKLESIDYVVALPGGRGTEDMIKKAKSAGIPVVRIILKETE